MVNGGKATRDLRVLLELGEARALTDGQLLGRFVDRREGAIFEAIVLRHGPIVWGVCRRILRDHHDAEDAFQATFLVLARRAASVAQGEKLGNWLYGVAHQTAQKARGMRARRRAREGQVTDLPEPEAAGVVKHEDCRGELDRELSRLPEKYRLPIVLCELEGLTHREAAEQIGCPIGTVSSRLSRAKAMLMRRLSRRAVPLSDGSMAVLLFQEVVSVRMPTHLIGSTARAASLSTAGQAVEPSRIVVISQGVLTSMLMKKILVNATAVLGFTVLVGLAYGTSGSGTQDPPAEGVKPPARPNLAAPAAVADPREATPLTVDVYQIKWNWSENGQEEKQGPTVTSESGTPVHFAIGQQEVNDPRGGTMPVGTSFSTTIIRAKGGKVCVDIRADRVACKKPFPNADDEVRVEGQTIQVIKLVKLGEKAIFEMNPAQDDPKSKLVRLELIVSQMEVVSEKVDPTTKSKD